METNLARLRSSASSARNPDNYYTAADKASPKVKEHETPMEENKAGDHSSGISQNNLREEEKLARSQTTHSILYLVVVNLYSALVVFVVHLISVESIISIALSVALTLHVHNLTQGEEDSTTNMFDGSTMSWVLLSFAVITPISGAISMAFSRREQALVQIAQLRSAMMQLYIAHASWDWEFKDLGTGRERTRLDLVAHADRVHRDLVGIMHDLTRYLTMPNVTRARHRLTPTGIRENTAVRQVQTKLFTMSIERIASLSEACEILKKDGLPGNEASRIRQCK